MTDFEFGLAATLDPPEPYAFSYASDSTEVAKVLRAMRSARGLGRGHKVPEGGILDAWDHARAEAISSAYGQVRAAATQFWAHTATTHLPVYEDLLLLPSTGTDDERRIAAGVAWALKRGATQPEIRAALQEIDANLDVASRDTDDAATTVPGKWLAPLSGTPDFGDQPGSQWPNYASHYVQIVTYELPTGETQIPSATMAAARRQLNDQLPAWVDFTIRDDGDGFYLDGGVDEDSLLDQTAFG